MSYHNSIDGDGTSESPMVVPSDESVGDGDSSPDHRDNDREACQDVYEQVVKQVAQDIGISNQGTAATGSQPAASTPLPPPSSVPILPALAINNSSANTVSNVPSSSTVGFVSGNTTVTASVPAASAQINGPSTGVLSNATVTGSVLAHVPTPGARVARTMPAGVNQVLRHEGETFTLHPTDPTKIIARFRVEIPHQLGEYYEQVDTIPMHDETAISPKDPIFYFVPDLTRSKIEKKIRKSKKNNGQPSLWVRQGTSYTWTRKDPKGGSDQVFQLRVMFRRFNSTTHKSEEIYLNLRMLKNADPNKKSWMYAYNKWIDQIRRRRDSTYTKIMHKDHWSVAERRALCDAVNAYIRKAGLCRFGSGADVQIPQADMQVMADAVNNAGDIKRRPDAVRSQIFSSHTKKNKAIFDVVVLAKSLRARLARGEVVSRTERYPKEAIPRHAFPKDLTTKKLRAVAKEATPKKRHHTAAMYGAESELSNVPTDSRSPSRAADIPLPSYMSNFLGSGNPGGMCPSKKVKFATESGNELASDDQWVETDEEILSEGAERAREEMEWESTGCEEVSGDEATEGEIDHMEEPRDDESSEEEDDDDDQEIERQHAVDLQKAIYRSHQRAPILVGVAVPGEDGSSDSDSDTDSGPSQPDPAVASSRKPLKSGQRSDKTAAGPAPSSPPKKRKRTPEAEDDASEGNGKPEMGSPQ